MPSLSRVIIADADAKAAQTLAIGFGREGVVVDRAQKGGEVVPLLARAGAELVVTSVDLDGDEDGVELVRRLRQNGAPGARVPIIVHGAEERRDAALAAGATDFVGKPAFVRDVVTLGQLLAGVAAQPGDLHFFYVLRALAAAQRTCVVTLGRAGRRGELRFYRGEVTSAQVGTLHGLAALHQLLLWTDARIDIRGEDVVRRQQIPLSREELYADAERFLRDFHELAGELYPAQVLEQVDSQIQALGEGIPNEVTPVIRLFDGERTLADVIEDSPFRMVETVRIARKLAELGAIVRLQRPRVKGGKALVIEDWLVGGTPPSGVTIPIAAIEGAAPAAAATEWGKLPQQATWDSAHFAPVVPALSTSGEIQAGDMVAELERSAPHSLYPDTTNGKANHDSMNATRKVESADAEPDAPDDAGDVVTAVGKASPQAAFAAIEEEFFAQESKYTEPPPPAESFDDLVPAGPPPRGRKSLWQRLFGAEEAPANPPPATVAAPVVAAAPAPKVEPVKAEPVKAEPAKKAERPRQQHKRKKR